MILLRESRMEDVPLLSRLAQMPGPGFYGLPSDEHSLKDRVEISVKSFLGKSRRTSDARYLMVAEDLTTGEVVGTSTIRAQYGTEDSPNFYFEVGVERKFSETINTGFLHGTLILRYDTQGPSEIGGLVVHPDYRQREDRLGRQISFVRFLYMGMHRSQFKKRLLTELLPPFNRDGQSPLWEAVGRRFTNMEYWEADQLCSQNKEFILSLFPTGKIYTTFLPAEARDSIGKVGDQTKPVHHMLTKAGFRYENKIDPFDGGPHLVCDTDQVVPIQKIQTLRLKVSTGTPSKLGEKGLISSSFKHERGFQAVAVTAVIEGDTLILPNQESTQKLQTLLSLSTGDSVVFMPYY